jgi:hypothetical protein
VSDCLELAYAFGFDLLALRLALLALDAEFVFFRDVVLLGLAVDGIDHERRQFNALHQRIGVSQRNVAMKASAAARLLRAYAAQVEVLRRLRNGGSQLVRVEHVHVNDGGQAAIGNVRYVEKFP